MTKHETTQLTQLKDGQASFTKSIETIFERLDKQDKLLTNINKTLSEFNGAKKAMMWLLATVIAIAGVVAEVIRVHRHN